MADFQNEGEPWEWHIIETFKGLINLSIELLKALTVNQRRRLRSRFSLISESSLTRWCVRVRARAGAPVTSELLAEVDHVLISPSRTRSMWTFRRISCD
jgi:hypothetical protein